MANVANVQVETQRQTRMQEGLALTWTPVAGAIRYAVIVGFADMPVPPVDVIMKGATKDFAILGIPARYSGAVDLGSPVGEERQYGLIAYRGDGSIVPAPGVRFCGARSAPRDREYHALQPPALVRSHPVVPVTPPATPVEVKPPSADPWAALQDLEAAQRATASVAPAPGATAAPAPVTPPPSAAPPIDPWDVLGASAGAEDAEAFEGPAATIVPAASSTASIQYTQSPDAFVTPVEPSAVPPASVPAPITDPWDVLNTLSAGDIAGDDATVEEITPVEVAVSDGGAVADEPVFVEESIVGAGVVDETRPVEPDAVEPEAAPAREREDGPALDTPLMAREPVPVPAREPVELSDATSMPPSIPDVVARVNEPDVATAVEERAASMTTEEPDVAPVADAVPSVPVVAGIVAPAEYVVPRMAPEVVVAPEAVVVAPEAVVVVSELAEPRLETAAIVEPEPAPFPETTAAQLPYAPAVGPSEDLVTVAVDVIDVAPVVEEPFGAAAPGDGEDVLFAPDVDFNGPSARAEPVPLPVSPSELAPAVAAGAAEATVAAEAPSDAPVVESAIGSFSYWADDGDGDGDGDTDAYRELAALLEPGVAVQEAPAVPAPAALASPSSESVVAPLDPRTAASVAALLDEADLYLLPSWLDYVEVARLVGQAAALAPADPRVLDLQQQIERAQGGPAGGDVDALLREARQALDAGDHWRAVALYEQALERHGDNDDARQGLERARLHGRWGAQRAAAGSDPVRLRELGDQSGGAPELAARAYADLFDLAPSVAALRGWLLALAHGGDSAAVVAVGRRGVQALRADNKIVAGEAQERALVLLSSATDDAALQEAVTELARAIESAALH